MLEQEVEKIVAKKRGNVTVDLNGANFLLSSAIAQVIKLYRYCKAQGTVFRVINAGECANMLRTLKFDEIFEIID